jgi:hypothetical protein
VPAVSRTGRRSEFRRRECLARLRVVPRPVALRLLVPQRVVRPQQVAPRVAPAVPVPPVHSMVEAPPLRAPYSAVPLPEVLRLPVEAVLHDLRERPLEPVGHLALRVHLVLCLAPAASSP